jgi:hypothetical protein
MALPVPRPCVCGGASIAPPDDSYTAIVRAINDHARTDQRHLAWQSRMLLGRGPLVRPAGPENAPQLPVDELGRAVLR